MKKHVLLLGCAVVSMSLSAQKTKPQFFTNEPAGAGTEAFFYGMVQSVVPYTDLVSPDSTFTDVWDDEMYAIVPNNSIPVTGSTVDTIYIEYGAIAQANLSNWEMVGWAPMNTDLIDRGYATNTNLSPISYSHLSSGGVVIEWKNAGLYEDFDDGGNSMFVNLQLRLFDDGIFEFRYGSSYITPTMITTLAIWDELMSGQESTWSPNNSAGYIHTLSGNPANAVLVDSLTSLTAWPDSGTSYMFVPLTSWSVDEMDEIRIAPVPNPLHSELRLKAPTNEVYSFTLTDAHGRIVRTASICNGQGVPVMDLPRGIYIATYQKEGDEPKSFRVVLE